jgi:hypothetical protein
MFKVLSKNHGLNYCKLDYQRGITYGKKYLMNMRYPFQSILEIHWAP